MKCDDCGGSYCLSSKTCHKRTRKHKMALLEKEKKHLEGWNEKLLNELIENGKRIIF